MSEQVLMDTMLNLKSDLGNLLSRTSGLRAEFTEQIKSVVDRMNAFEVRAADPHLHGYNIAGGGTVDPVAMLCKKISENKDLLNKSGRIILQSDTLLPEKKTVLLSSGLTTPTPLNTIEAGGRPEYYLRSIFRTLPADGASVWRIKETAFNSGASPVAEGALKGESTVTLSAAAIPLEIFAHFVNCSRQTLDDIVGFQEYLSTTLGFGLEAKVEQQILFGDGSSPNLDGLSTNATAFDLTLLNAGDGYEYSDILAAAAVQLRNLGFSCDTFILSPSDWFKIETLKDADGNYVVGNPKSALARVLWGRQVVESPAMIVGSFMALDSRRFHVRQRMQATVELSYEHASNFTSNLVTVRAEERLCFVVGRADACVLGSLTQSPA